MTTSIAREDLVRFLAATGHPPRIEPIAFSGERETGSPPKTRQTQ
jgi:hypothetical protein